MTQKYRFSRAPKKTIGPSKTQFIIGFIIAVFAAWSVIMVAETVIKPEPVPAPVTSGGAVCGNGFVELGENCATCFLDARCISGEVCQQGFCAKERASLLWFTMPIIFMILVGILFVSYKMSEIKGIEETEDLQRINSLIDYISQSRKAGHSDSEIKINILHAGWTERDAEKALKESD